MLLRAGAPGKAGGWSLLRGFGAEAAWTPQEERFFLGARQPLVSATIERWGGAGGAKGGPGPWSFSGSGPARAFQPVPGCGEVAEVPPLYYANRLDWWGLSDTVK